MIRNLKALGLVFAASFAMTAMAASAAQAAPEFWTAEAAKVTFIPDTTGFNLVSKLANIETITCKELTAKATLEEPQIALLSTNLSYTSCDADAGKKFATVATNGCEYRYTVLASLGGEEFEGEYHVFCPEGEKVEFLVYHDAGHTELECAISIPPQSVEEAVQYKNIGTLGGPKIITLKMFGGKVKEEYVGEGCGAGEKKDVELSGNLLVHAESIAKKVPIDIKIKNTP